jgi:hypothetical protein
VGEVGAARRTARRLESLSSESFPQGLKPDNPLAPLMCSDPLSPIHEYSVLMDQVGGVDEVNALGLGFGKEFAQGVKSFWVRMADGDRFPFFACVFRS